MHFTDILSQYSTATIYISITNGRASEGPVAAELIKWGIPEPHSDITGDIK